MLNLVFEENNGIHDCDIVYKRMYITSLDTWMSSFYKFTASNLHKHYPRLCGE